MKISSLLLIIFFAVIVQAQNFNRNYDIKSGGLVEITNLYGRVEIQAGETGAADDKNNNTAIVQANTNKSLIESDLKIANADGNLKIEAAPQSSQTRVDLIIKLPPRVRVRVRTGEGEVRVSGNLQSADVETDTGTISVDVPLDDVRYNFVWTESRPRFLSDVELEKVREKAAGKFVVKGKIQNEKEKGEENTEVSETVVEETASSEQPTENENKDKKSKNKSKEQRTKSNGQIELNLTTARGIILLNVNPNEVPSDLRERPLTDAAKAIIRSGDSLLMEAIRRASPKYFGDYAKTLPPLKREPTFADKKAASNTANSQIKKVLIRVTDINNRAIPDLQAKDFEVTESGIKREILSVEPTTAPFNLILLLDVSGSVDNYVDFIRKAARNFVNTVQPNDKIAIIIFNEDVKTLSTFTTNKGKLSESLDTFDAGGGTAFYDALAFTLAETLRPLKGERTAIVTLTDGDDNRSFLSFESLLGSIQESGALVYPLYVPSGLIAASQNRDPNATVDPLRTRYMALTSKAEDEGEKLAQISGGVYYPIRQLDEIQKAYDDIVVQLRTAYSITFRSDAAETGDGRASPRLKVKVNRENAFVKLGSVVEVKPRKTSELNKRNFPHRENQAFQKISFSNSQINSLNFLANFAPLREISFPKAAYSLSSLNQLGEISGEVEKINYKQFVNDNLRTYKFENFDINNSIGAFLLSDDKEKIAVSRWISPKRTRSYPYERVYDTLAQTGKKVTVIPVVKDEGLGGERDFLQWDTISLLSLLDIHVVLAYYKNATKNTKRNDQITAQKLDNEFVTAKLNEVFNFKGTAREWNEKEAKELKNVFEKARNAYAEISKDTKTYLHDETPLNELIKLTENLNNFAQFSRNKSQKGQNRELQSIQPKEALSTDTKGSVTITNLNGGKYFFTCDETLLQDKTLYLIEDKHSSRAILPSENDIKDGLLKMMIYTNLKNVRVGKKAVTEKAVLRLTSSKLVGSINSDTGAEVIAKFFETNRLDISKQNLIKKLFQEARENKFTIILEKGETAK
ncbi:MAG: VWA domain-containing protein [Acidobacteria bacterium]|jgi:VWFA-related protein|nr:VWA domain-containing protein [Acidobacteriota bacterium]